jgi:hypothetical protein
VTSLRSDFQECIFPEPELWHWENVAWVKRSRFAPLFERAARGEAADSLLLEDARGLTARDVERFWAEFVPQVAAFGRDDWSNLSDLVSSLEERYTSAELRRFARVHGRLCYFLLARLEPLFERSWFRPKIAVRNYFELGMLASDVIVRGKNAYGAVFADPAAACALAAELTAARGLFMIAIFRYDAMVFEAQKMRLLRAIMEPEGRRTTAKDQERERLFARIGERLFAIATLSPFMVEQFKGPAYERGFPERYPKFKLTPSAAVVRIETAAADLGSTPT